MNRTGKPLTIRQEMKLEHYLVTLQEFVLDSENTDLLELLTEISNEVSEFMTPSELEAVEAESILTKEELEPTQKNITLELLLPYGYDPEEYEASVTSVSIDNRNKVIHFRGLISLRPPEDLLEDR